MSHGIVRTDRMQGTDVNSGVISVKYMGSGSTETAIDNGNVVKIGALIDREVYTGTTPAADDNIKDIALIASPEVMYDERKRGLGDYENEAGKICRAYYFYTNNVFSVNKDALDGVSTPEVGDIVELQAGTKLNVKAAATGATSGSTVIGKIDAVETTGNITYYVIKVN